MSDMDGKPHRVAASESGDERVQSQFVIRSETNRNIQRCFTSLNMPENSRAREKLPIMAIPITLKALSRIVLSFEVQKLFELRVARHDLLWFCEFMVSQIIASAAGYRQINQAAKGARGRFNAVRCVEREQIKDDARGRFFGPSEQALIIFFHQPDC